MQVRKNAILIFSKPPIPGLVKTRLSTIKDGIFSPEIASWLYHCMLFDVVEICCDAIKDLSVNKNTFNEDNTIKNDIKDTYSLIISTTPPDKLSYMKEVFQKSGEWPYPIEFIADKGASFDEHYEDAFRQVWDMGFDCILSMGADMPALPRRTVIEGFTKLHEVQKSGYGVVISPDQAMGVSIIGWTKDTPMDHQGIYYNQDGITVLPGYIKKARQRNIPCMLIEAVPDIDCMLDLMHSSTLVDAINYCSDFEDISMPQRTLEALKYIGWDEIRVAPNELRDSREGIDV